MLSPTALTRLPDMPTEPEKTPPPAPTAPADSSAPAAAPVKKKKVKKNVARGIVHIKSTFNNTTITITDRNGACLCWDSGGTIGYKASRKSTPFAAQRAAEQCAS